MQGRESLVVTLAVVLAVLVLMVAGENNCDYNTCSKCIGAPSCIWCSDPNITLVKVDTGGTLPHCISKQSSSIERFIEACKDNINDPATVEKIIENEELSENPIVQLRPQRVSLEMRTEESATITVKYRHLRSYPMDVYCLMDGSKSMSSLKTSLSDLTNELVEGLEKLSNNIKLGFGMFVDKPLLPYTDMNMWSSYNCKDCVETFSFQNILPLTTERMIFQEKVNSTKGSTNIDRPEGTLDALMQVASCPGEVGWRDEGVKVVVVFTDAGFHIAGDGRLAGIVKPNDKKCHLDNEGKYTYSKWQDYPSVSELTSVLDETSVYTTFAVEPELLPLYNLLASQLPRCKSSNITEHSSNLVSLITEFAKEAISTVNLKKPKNIMEGVAVDVTSRCKGNEKKDTSICKDMEPGDEAEFFVNIKIKNCPKEENLNTTLKFILDGYSQSLLVDLKLLCQCECDQEKGQGLIPNADECSNKGDLRCGACSCNEGFLGNKCQCKEGDSSNLQVDEKNCIQPNVSSTLVCSGQGQCVCGLCQCDKRQDPKEIIEGQYCQCTNFKNCYGSNGDICSGNGECQCDECHCNAGWEGEFCDCQNSTTECQVSHEEEICSNHGKCICNKCQCAEDYLGKYCQDCKNCEIKCDEHKFCVQCLVFDAGAGCKDACSSYNVTIVPDMKEHGQLCVGIDDDGCRFLYQFKHNGDKVLVWAQNQKECPIEINTWAVVGGILGAVVLVGLLLLIAWKVITHIKDKQEYESFLKNRSMAIWSDNVSPLYKPATTTVQNPLFDSASAGQK